MSFEADKLRQIEHYQKLAERQVAGGWRAVENNPNKVGGQSYQAVAELVKVTSYLLNEVSALRQEVAQLKSEDSQ